MKQVASNKTVAFSDRKLATMKEILDIILDDPKAFILDGIGCLAMFASWIALYIILACFA